ncbi:MAG: hypothetical protein DRH51_01360 [Candidatus Coatesbacteria bacterium]|nr:MAG: hypothetical protein DRH51_01360 [Candidatus Coatesbacteria bacterium]
MALYHSSDIGPSGIISRLDFQSSRNSQSVSYSYFVVNFCHTSFDELVTRFNDNYDGNDEVLVYRAQPGGFSGDKDDWVVINFNKNDFVYNGNDNIIVEVKWSGCSHSSLYNYTFNTDGDHMIYSYNAGVNAEYAQYKREEANRIRLTIEYTAVENTSLGAVRALFN